LAVGGTATTFTTELRIAGTVAAPALTGHARFAGEPALIGSTPVMMDEAIFEFRPGAELDPSLTLRATGTVLAEPFVAHAAGPLSRLVRFFSFDPPLTEELLRSQLGAAPAIFQPEFSLLAPAVQAGGVEIHPWAPIDGTPAPAGTPQPAPAPAGTPVGAPQ
jgi:hypothetical protein